MINRNHPDVNWFYEELDKASTPRAETILNSEDIRDLCLKNGADDVGFVEIDRTALGGQKEGILEAFPLTRSETNTLKCISVVHIADAEIQLS